MNQHCTQAEFARLLGVAKSYVTKLKEHGRLVMSADGKLVDIEASKARVAATADPGKPDVSAKWAAPAVVAKPAADYGDDAPAGSGSKYHDARAEKEHYAALSAKLDYEKAIGKVVDKADVQAVVEDVITQFRQGLENLPYRLAPELVGQDLDGIRAALKQEVFDSLAKMQRGFVRQMEEIGKGEQ